MEKLTIGSKIPSITSSDQNGKEINLSQFNGKKLVVYFYPKDDTPGCTIEAQDFTKYAAEFEKLNCIILGISKDSVKSHCGFVKKYQLAFNLLSDIDGEVCDKYGVIKEKSMFGKKYFGIERSTFLINQLGKIVKILCNGPSQYNKHTTMNQQQYIFDHGQL